MGSKTVRPLVLTIDVGSSSVRAAIYDANASRVPGLEARLGHELVTTPDGGVVADAEHIASLVEEALDMVLTAAGDVAGHIAGVAMDTIASSVLGVDDGGSPVTPIYTYADTQPTAEVAALKRELDVVEVYDRTGCPQHTSYLPARVLWLRNAFPELNSRLSKWADVGAFLYRRWFGKTVPMSYSMASWTGMLDRRRLEWDAGLMEHLSLTADDLPPLDDYSSGQRGLAPDYANRWPALADVPFFLSIGDGAGANVGSGCVSAESVALTVGTSGAMRMLVPDAAPKIPEGLWGYRLGDSTLIGGSLTDGGSVYAWARETLNLPKDDVKIEGLLQSLPPGAHGLSLLPLFSGERSPGWAADASGVISGLRMSTMPIHILQAALEAVAYRFDLVWRLLLPYVSYNCRVIASGGALTRSPYWLQVMADVLGRTVTVCVEDEATSRGTAILALASLGLWSRLDAVPAALGDTFEPNPRRTELYRKLAKEQQMLYARVIAKS